MKRWALLLLLSLALPASAFATARTSTGNGAWATAGTWDPAATPGAGDDLTINHVVTCDSAACAGRNVIVNGTGTIRFDEGGTLDADGYHVLTLTTTASPPVINLQNGSAFRIGRTGKVVFDTTAGAAQIAVSNGAALDWQGVTYTTSVDSIVYNTGKTAGQPTECGTGTSGEQWEITLPNAIAASYAKPKRRVVFQSGAARNRHMEIAIVSGNTITVCPDYLSSGSSQHLTQHASTGGDATPPGGFAVPHITPTTDASGNKTYTTIRPVAGDTLTIVQDGWIRTTSATGGWYLATPVGVGFAPMPIIRAMHLERPGDGGTNWGTFVAPSAGVSVTFDYNNWYDYGHSHGLLFDGLQNSIAQWNAWHDAGSESTDSTVPFAFLNSEVSSGHPADIPSLNNQVSDNVIYATKGNGVSIVPIGDVMASGFRADRNLLYGGCTGTAECTAIEIVGCNGCRAMNNVIYNWCRAGNDAGVGISLGGSTSAAAGKNTNTVAVDNWLANICVTGMTLGETDANEFGAATHNYLSHMKFDALHLGHLYSNVVKNWGMDDTGAGIGAKDPATMSGNYFLGNDANTAAGTDCDGSGCARYGVSYEPWAYLTSAYGTLQQTDNIITGVSDSIFTPRPIAIDRNGAGFPLSINLAHLTLDARGASASSVFMENAIDPGSAVTWTVADIYATHNADNLIVDCTSAANITDTVGAVYGNDGLTSAEDTGSGQDAQCSSSGTLTRPFGVQFRNRLASDYGLRTGASGLTAGSGSTAIGSRAFRFNRDRINRLWGGILTFGEVSGSEFPGDFSNGNASNVDSDGDGVMDLHDNCDSVVNPSQSDPDGDGKGCACDSGESC